MRGAGPTLREAPHAAWCIVGSGPQGRAWTQLRTQRCRPPLMPSSHAALQLGVRPGSAGVQSVRLMGREQGLDACETAGVFAAAPVWHGEWYNLPTRMAGYMPALADAGLSAEGRGPDTDRTMAGRCQRSPHGEQQREGQQGDLCLGCHALSVLLSRCSRRFNPRLASGSLAPAAQFRRTHTEA